MPSLQYRLTQALRDILKSLFSSPTRKLCVLALDGNRVMRFEADSGGFIDRFITFDDGLLPAFGMCFGIDGHLLVPMTKSGTALPFPIGTQRFHGTNGGFIDTFAPWPLISSASAYDTPDCCTLGPDGHLYVGSGSAYPGGAGPIYRYHAQTGAFIDVFVAARSGGMQCPGTLRFGPDGHLYVRNCSPLDPAYGYNILRFDGRTGAFIDIFVPVAPEFFNFYGGMAFGPDGHLYLSEVAYSGVRRYDGVTGALIDDFVPKGQANYPCGLTFAGEDLYVANRGGAYAETRYGNISRYDGKTGNLTQICLLLGAETIHPTDVIVTVADIPLPNFNVVGNWREVPLWVKVITAGVLGIVLGQVFSAARTPARRE